MTNFTIRLLLTELFIFIHIAIYVTKIKCIKDRAFLIHIDFFFYNVKILKVF